MLWFRRNDAPNVFAGDPRFASTVEIRDVFESQREQLLWLAEVITGDPKLAAQCVIDASKITETSSTIFRDWLAKWARNATVRSSLAHMHAQISHTAEAGYEGVPCPPEGHDVLSSSEVAALMECPASGIASQLDPLSRAVLILRGVQHAAVQDCALTLAVSRAVILAAYRRATDWLTHRPAAPSDEFLPGSVPGLAQSLQRP